MVRKALEYTILPGNWNEQNLITARRTKTVFAWQLNNQQQSQHLHKIRKKTILPFS